MLIVSRDSHTQNIIHFPCLCHTFVFYTWTFYMSGCSLIMCSDWKGPSYIFLPTHWLVNANFERKSSWTWNLKHNSWRKPPKKWCLSEGLVLQSEKPYCQALRLNYMKDRRWKSGGNCLTLNYSWHNCSYFLNCTMCLPVQSLTCTASI